MNSLDNYKFEKKTLFSSNQIYLINPGRNINFLLGATSQPHQNLRKPSI